MFWFLVVPVNIYAGYAETILQHLQVNIYAGQPRQFYNTVQNLQPNQSLKSFTRKAKEDIKNKFDIVMVNFEVLNYVDLTMQVAFLHILTDAR